MGFVGTDKAPAKRRSYRRRNTMNVSLTVAMTEQMRADVETEAIADNVSAADVIRMALSEALPRMKGAPAQACRVGSGQRRVGWRCWK